MPFAFEVNPEDSDIRNKLVYNGDFDLKRVLKRYGQYIILEADEINTGLRKIDFVANSQNLRSREGKRLQKKFYLFGRQRS